MVQTVQDTKLKKKHIHRTCYFLWDQYRESVVHLTFAWVRFKKLCKNQYLEYILYSIQNKYGCSIIYQSVHHSFSSLFIIYLCQLRWSGLFVVFFLVLWKPCTVLGEPWWSMHYTINRTNTALLTWYEMSVCLILLRQLFIDYHVKWSWFK